MREVWKDILGYEGAYQISNTGKIQSLPRDVPHEVCRRNGVTRTEVWHHKGSSIKPIWCKSSKHVDVRLYDVTGYRSVYKLYKLILLTFAPKKYVKVDRGDYFVGYKDGDIFNCALSNLVLVKKSRRK